MANGVGTNDDFLFSSDLFDSSANIDDGLLDSSSNVNSKPIGKGFNLQNFQPIEVFRSPMKSDFESSEIFGVKFEKLLTEKPTSLKDKYKRVTSVLNTVADLINSIGSLSKIAEDRDTRINSLFLPLCIESWRRLDDGSFAKNLFSDFEKCFGTNFNLPEWQKMIISNFEIIQITPARSLPSLNSIESSAEYEFALSTLDLLTIYKQLTDEIKLLDKDKSSELIEEKKAQAKEYKDSLERINQKYPDILSLVDKAYKNNLSSESGAIEEISKDLRSKSKKSSTPIFIEKFDKFSSQLECKIQIKEDDMIALIKFNQKIEAVLNEIVNNKEEEFKIKLPAILGLNQDSLGVKVNSIEAKVFVLGLILDLYNASRQCLSACLVEINHFSDYKKSSKQELKSCLSSVLKEGTLISIIENFSKDEKTQLSFLKKIVELYKLPVVVNQEQVPDCRYEIFNPPELTRYLMKNLVESVLSKKLGENAPHQETAKEIYRLFNVALQGYDADLNFLNLVFQALKKEDFRDLGMLLTRRIRNLKSEFYGQGSVRSEVSKQQLALSMAFCVHVLASLAENVEIAKHLRLQVPNIDQLQEFVPTIAEFNDNLVFYNEKVKLIKKVLSNSLQDAPLSPENKKKLEKALKYFLMLHKFPELAASSSGDELFESGIFFPGEAGVGKTFLIKCIENETGAHRIDISLMSAIQKAIDSAEDVGKINLVDIVLKAYSEACERAKKGELVLLVIDEAESVLVNRLLANITQEQTMINNLMLQIISDIRRNYPNILILVATNFKDKIDKAGIRRGRIDVEIELTDPSPEIRKIVITSEIFKALDVCNLDHEPSPSEVDDMIKYSEGLQFVVIKQAINEIIRFEWTEARMDNSDFVPDYQELIKSLEQEQKKLNLVSGSTEKAAETSAPYFIGDISKIGIK
jgi:AAA+ superfamily predicted ATPase